MRTVAVRRTTHLAHCGTLGSVSPGVGRVTLRHLCTDSALGDGLTADLTHPTLGDANTARVVPGAKRGGSALALPVRFPPAQR